VRCSLVHPTGTHWRVFEEQSNLVAAYLQAQDKKSRFVYKFEKLKRQISSNLSADNKRHSGTHSLVIDKLGYIRQAQGLARRLLA